MHKNTKPVTLKKPNCGEVDTVARTAAKSSSFLISSLLLDKILVGKKHIYTGWFFNWSALKMTKYKEKLKYLNWSANCSSQKVLSVKPQ